MREIGPKSRFSDSKSQRKGRGGKKRQAGKILWSRFLLLGMEIKTEVSIEEPRCHSTPP